MGPSGRLVIKTTCTISKPLPWILKALKNEATFTEKRETRSDNGVSNQQECRFSLIIYCVYLWTQSTIPAHDKGPRNLLCHTQTPIYMWKQLLASFLIILLWPLTDNLHTFTHCRRFWHAIVLKYTLPFYSGRKPETQLKLVCCEKLLKCYQIWLVLLELKIYSIIGIM